MDDTFSWSMLKNPFFGETDEMNKYDLHAHFTPKTLLPIESWLFWNRDSWEDVPYLSVRIIFIILDYFSFYLCYYYLEFS